MQLATKQQYFIDQAVKGVNIFLTGKAGAGKSYVVMKVIQKLKSIGKKVAAVAPSGIAANNSGIFTIGW